MSLSLSLEAAFREEGQEWRETEGRRRRVCLCGGADRAYAELLLREGKRLSGGSDVWLVRLKEIEAVPTLFEAAKANDVLLLLEVERSLLDSAGYDESRQTFDYVDVALSAKRQKPGALAVSMWKNRYGERAEDLLVCPWVL